MEKMTVRGVPMTKSMYEECVEIAGARKFSEFVRDLVQAELARRQSSPGCAPGGLCAGPSLDGPCGRGDAWVYLKSRRAFVCETCRDYIIKCSPSTAHLFEDRRPKFTKEEHREQLIQAAKSAWAALDAFDRGNKVVPQPVSKVLNMPADIAAALLSARGED